MTDLEVVTAVNAAFIAAWAVPFGVIAIADFFSKIAGR